MNTSRNSQLDFRTRLIAFIVVLAVGFAMGWFKGQDGQDPVSVSTGIVAQQSQGETETSSSPVIEPEDAADDDEAAADAPATTQEQSSDDSGSDTVAPTRGPTVERDGWYTTKEEVALYIHTYGRLPGNFISKTKARARGWEASEGNLDEVCPGMSIGGSRFYNDDGLLPNKRGRQWTECDINYHGGFRGAERIVFSNDGLIFYTDDHYETFEQLY